MADPILLTLLSLIAVLLGENFPQVPHTAALLQGMFLSRKKKSVRKSNVYNVPLFVKKDRGRTIDIFTHIMLRISLKGYTRFWNRMARRQA